VWALSFLPLWCNQVNDLHCIFCLFMGSTMKQLLSALSLALLSCSSTSNEPAPSVTKPTPPIKKETSSPAPSWRKSLGAPPVDLLGVSFLSDKEASIVADMGPGNGPVLHTQNAGDTWIIGTTATEILTDVSFDSAKGAAVGYAGQISLTEDGARSWKVMRRDEETILRGVARRDDVIVAVGESALLVSKDAGKSFEAIPLREPLALQEVILWSDTESAAVTSGGELIVTKDLWKTFIKNPLTKEPLFGLARLGTQLCAVGGRGLIICVGEDNEPKIIPSGVNIDLFDVAFADKHGVAVGAKGTILTTKDNLGWAKEESGSTEDLFSVAARGVRMIAVGTNGTILVRNLE
jgi:photosystem II stability/assembly factor-like uncharacterized protein